MFKKEGEYMLKSLKKARKILNRQTKRQRRRREKYFLSLPICLRGRVPNSQGNSGSNRELEMEGHIEMDGREKPAVKTQRQDRKKSKGYLQIECYRQA